ncbi:MAG: hypothetical protein P4K83_03990 [Terracidiphilus sp.]|nr:hypothetical protein [Terracidiphilus sp.]
MSGNDAAQRPPINQLMNVRPGTANGKINATVIIFDTANKEIDASIYLENI